MRPGVLRVLGPVAEVAAGLRERGWSVAVVPPARTDAELWDGLVLALDLPGWFGRNLDALDEVLGERAAPPAPPTAMVLTGWTTYARARPQRFRGLLEILGAHALVALAD